MARIKNGSFNGSPPSDVDVGSPTWMRVLRTAIGDLALVYDKVTGLNGETSTINHGGTRGRGARLGFPWINQTFSGRGDRIGQWGIDLGYVMAPDDGSKTDGGVGSDTIVFGVPVFIPPGETDMTVRITGKGLGIYPWRVELREEATGDIVFQRAMVVSQDRSGLFDVCSVSTNDNGTDGAGMLCLLLIYADTSRRQQVTGHTPDGQVRAYSLFAGPTRLRRGTSGRIARSTTDFGITTGDPFTWVDFDELLLTARAPLSSYLTGFAARNMNALIEYVTGYPVGGNSAYTLVDSGDTNPTTSRFMAHTKSTLSTEPEIAMPLMAAAFGAAMLDGTMVIDAIPPTAGMLDWSGLIPRTTARELYWRGRVQVPDFDTTASKLKACTLAVSDVAAQAVNFRASIGDGASVVGADAAFAAVSTTKLYTAKHTAITFTPDAEMVLGLGLSKTAAIGTIDELCVLGTCLYFEP